MYTVIGHPKSRALRVIRALEEMELAYEIVPTIPGSGEAKQYNPTGKIPCLKDGDTVISDSTAIVTYLADKHGKLTHAAGTIERAQQDAITNYIMCEVDAALWLAAKHRFALPEKLRMPEIKDTAIAEFTRSMAHLTEVLGDKPFLTGESMTIPDIILSQCAGWAVTAKFPLPDGPMGDYLTRMRKTPAMERIKSVLQNHA
ncbi:glutathione S-transferase family protein [Halovulum sp. GXIMD14793]